MLLFQREVEEGHARSLTSKAPEVSSSRKLLCDWQVDTAHASIWVLERFRGCASADSGDSGSRSREPIRRN